MYQSPSPLPFEKDLADGTRLFGWKSESPLTPFAPDYTHYFSDKKIFSEEECKEWNDYLLKQEELLLDKHRISMGSGGTGLGADSITSRFPYFNVLKFNFHHIERFKTEIFKGIQKILDVSGHSTWQETLYANSWLNVMRQGEGMETHIHGYDKNIFYGFHLCINAKETFTAYQHPVKFQQEAFYVPNKVGYLTLFPDFIPHGVSPNRYETPRISIAGDIYAASRLKQPGLGPVQKNLVEL